MDHTEFAIHFFHHKNILKWELTETHISTLTELKEVFGINPDLLWKVVKMKPAETRVFCSGHSKSDSKLVIHRIY